MSTYPVRLSEWFPPGDEQYDIILSIVSYSRCYACGKHPRYLGAVGHHSLFVGYGDIWCSWKCQESGKKAKTDKRRQRRLNRRYREEPFFLEIERVEI
jgi:hypothetical protein